MWGMASETSVRTLADAISAATFEVDEQGRRLTIALWELLALGDPVTPAALARHADVDGSVVELAIETWPGLFRDTDGAVIGFWGLSIPEMPHRFQADGGIPIHAWCALDPFLLVPLIRRKPQAQSHHPVTREAIAITVHPDSVADLSPASAVVSFLVPDKPFDQGVIQSFCNYVHYFATEKSAGGWAPSRKGIAVLPERDAVDVGRLACKRFGEAAPLIQG